VEVPCDEVTGVIDTLDGAGEEDEVAVGEPADHVVGPLLAALAIWKLGLWPTSAPTEPSLFAACRAK